MKEKYIEVFSILKKEDNEQLSKIIDEIYDTLNKRQIFRTDTEARFSVLNDGKFPTRASKYWQSIREQAGMVESLISMVYEMKKNNIHIEQNKEKIEKEKDKWEKEILKIQLDELLWKKSSMEQVARDRVREILMWSKIKDELDDGSFDTTNPNTHQIESLRMQLEERAKAITPGTSQPEVLNVIGPLSTIHRYIEENNIQIEDKSQPHLKSTP
jgi:hypothetical protein